MLTERSEAKSPKGGSPRRGTTDKELKQKKIDEVTKKIRSRWRRWYGQKKRHLSILDLADVNYQYWLEAIRESHNLDKKAMWEECIDAANLDELLSLDCLILDMEVLK